MSLRVLLADESDTIKKVFQLALQDLNAEIKSVHSGLDVIDVAQAFKPNIIFADVLIQKKNGYETCREIKQNAQLSSVPVVLMWSSFMELDQDQFKKSKANDQLEKPFDADFLRELIKRHVPQAQENPLGQFLNFPKSITAELKTEAKPSGAINLPETPIEDDDTSEFNIASFLDEQLPGASTPEMPSAPTPSAPTSNKDESWLSADLSQFKIDLSVPSDNLEKFETFNLGEKSLPSLASITPPPPPPAAPKAPDVIQLPPPAPSIEISSVSQPVTHSSVSTSSPRTSTETKTRGAPSVTSSPTPEITNNKKVATIGLGDDEIEAIIRAHTEEIIKTQIRDTIADVVERIVRDELSRILDEEVRLKQDLPGDNY